ncbi:MAG: MoxR family ATPase [Lachnospira sp.]|jgi:MoxR-like ATPase|uniref:AAA family ATPase n=1 Tax=Lachnospira multipara TaxID=28051 RepID=UPI0003FB802A|nr:MoxR family ATPase [Lachnospira multipara]MBQ2473061.1 MoxR family ATPase [Lachnospira sp.]MCR5515249.1 MoxR family ATPase [Lachnospira sp.]
MFNNQDKCKLVLDNVNKVIVDKEDVTKLILTSVLASGHVLLEDVPGTGKTMLAKTFAKSIEGNFKRIQFTPDLLPSDITGIHIYNQKEEEFKFRRGPIFTNILLADEINRATPRTQSALLECMEETQVTVDETSFKLDAPFIVIATENPIETAGTYELPEAQLDRFLMKINMGYPSEEGEKEILTRFLKASPIESIRSVVTTKDILEMREEVKEVFIHPSLIEYIVNIATKTRNSVDISIGISPRASIAMVNAARAFAYVSGRTYVVPEDIKSLARVCFAHRLSLSSGAFARDNKEQIIDRIVSEINVPTEEWDK